MSIREDILTALRGEKPERVPWNIHHELLPRGTWERELRNQGLGIVDKGHSAYLSVAENVSIELKTSWEEGILATYSIYHTPAGDLQGKKVIGPDGSEWVTEYPVKGVDELRVLEFITEDTTFYANHEVVGKAQRDLGDDGIVLCRMLRSPLQRLLIEWTGVETFVFLLADHPGPMNRLLEMMAESDVAAFEITAASEAEVAWSAENITSSITSPKLFEQYSRPYYNRMAHILHAKGKLYGIHMDGSLAALATGLSETSVDFIEGLNPPPMGNLTITQARDAWPGKSLWVNFPGCVLLSDGKAVQEFAFELLQEGMKDNRFLLTFTEDFPEPERSLKWVGEAVGRYNREIA